MGELFVKEDTGKVWIWIEKQTGVCYTDYVLKTNFICGRMKRMLRRMKRTTASLLLVAMMSVTMFEGNVYAAEDTNADIVNGGGSIAENLDTDSMNQAETNDSIVPETDITQTEIVGDERVESSVSTPETEQSAPVEENGEEIIQDVSSQMGLINYVGIDLPYLETPADQNVVISYGDGSEDVTDARLVTQADDGTSIEMQLSKKEGELFLFTCSFDETASGVYTVTDFIYTQDGTEQTIHLADIGIESMFGVNEEYPGYGETYAEDALEGVTEQEVELSVVDVETGDVQEATTDIEEAIQTTEAQVGAAKASRAGRAADQKDGDLVVVLDPGHGGSDSGAVANGLVEKDLNLKIAQYCKEELEQYNGVTVYMTRSDDRYLGIAERVDLAEDPYHADVLVSIHINSATPAANGAEVYYPNENYNPSVHEPGKNLAQQIQNQLVSLGLTDRDIKVHNTINDTYPDGSKQDYYGIIRYSKLAGFPGIIVEHAFISNPGDAAKLAQESFLKQLGIADATGIANAYGLSKIKVTGKGEVTVSEDEMYVNITASIIEGERDVSKLSVAVWANVNGQNDLKWYDLSNGNNGMWNASFPLSDHAESGTYFADIYAVRKNGDMTILDSKSFTISDLSAEVSISEYDEESGTFELTASNIQSPSGIKEIRFPVWKDGDQSNTLYWYTAKEQPDGTYKATANIKNHNYAIGNYMSHIYITGKNGVTTSLVAGQREVTPADLSIDLTDVSVGGRESRYQIRALNIGVYGALGIEVAVWGDENGQNDLKWYNASLGKDGAWYADIEIADHKESGQYYADVYATMSNGAMMCIKSIPFTISSLSAEVSISEYDEESGIFELTASNIQSPSGIEEIRFPVWKDGDQSNTLYWYTAEEQPDGTYKAIANIENHSYKVGQYVAHIYVTGKNGVTTSLAAGNIEINKVINDELYFIMGESTTSVDQMIEYFHSTGVVYPAKELGVGGASTIEEFCKMVYEEAKIEGVKGEVVFAQIMLETGNLQFGNDVKIEQFNFGGLGATGNGVPGHTFADVRTGIRANVQHLKCYACAEPLVNQIVDPRWGEWLRNKAPYVQWLSIPNNPYGTGWATDKDYGTNILNIISKL